MLNVSVCCKHNFEWQQWLYIFILVKYYSDRFGRFFSGRWKNRFFRGKNRTGKNSFCRQKYIFCQNCHQSKLLLYYVFSYVLILSQLFMFFCTVICRNPLHYTQIQFSSILVKLMTSHILTFFLICTLRCAFSQCLSLWGFFLLF